MLLRFVYSFYEYETIPTAGALKTENVTLELLKELRTFLTISLGSFHIILENLLLQECFKNVKPNHLNKIVEIFWRLLTVA